jgi:sorbitol-specific phosphotransferase system component IIA
LTNGVALLKKTYTGTSNNFEGNVFDGPGNRETGYSVSILDDVIIYGIPATAGCGVAIAFSLTSMTTLKSFISVVPSGNAPSNALRIGEFVEITENRYIVGSIGTENEWTHIIATFNKSSNSGHLSVEEKFDPPYGVSKIAANDDYLVISGFSGSIEKYLQLYSLLTFTLDKLLLAETINDSAVSINISAVADSLVYSNKNGSRIILNNHPNKLNMNMSFGITAIAE